MWELAERILDKYGLPLLLLFGIALLSIYVFRALFNRKDGILRFLAIKVGEEYSDYMRKASDVQSNLSKSYSNLAKSAEEAHRYMESRNRIMESIAESHRKLVEAQSDPHSPLSNERLHRSGVHFVHVLEHISDQLGIYDKVKDSLEKIKHELEE